MFIHNPTLTHLRSVQALRAFCYPAIVPADPTDADLAALSCQRIQRVPMPAHDPLTQGVRELDAVRVDKQWFQQWEVFGLSPEESNDRIVSHRVSLRSMVDAERDRRIDAGFEFQGKWYQTRPDDRENIAGAAQTAFMAVMTGGGEPGNLYWQDGAQPFGWIAEDNTITPMDAPTVIEFGKAALAHKARLIFVAHEIKNADPIPEDFTADEWGS